MGKKKEVYEFKCLECDTQISIPTSNPGLTVGCLKCNKWMAWSGKYSKFLNDGENVVSGDMFVSKE